jgi:hypothetical protein
MGQAQQSQKLQEHQDHSPVEADWPTLVGRMLDDLARIIQMETRLFEANLSHALSGLVDRAISQLILLAAVLAGGSCLLAAFILLLHSWLVWWEALTIAGVAVIFLGGSIYMIGQRAARKTESQIAAG